MLADAICAAIDYVSTAFDTPVLNSIAVALGAVEGALLGSVDAKNRRILNAQIEAMRKAGIAEGRTRAPERLTVVKVRRFDA